MKTYSFNIFKCHVTITIEKKNYEVANPKIVTEQYTSTINDPLPEIKMEVRGNYPLFSHCCNHYINTHHGAFAESTLNGYKTIVNSHLVFLMDCDIDKVTEEIIQDAFDAEIAKGLSVKTLKGYKTFILKVLAEYRPDFHPNIRVTKECVNEAT